MHQVLKNVDQRHENDLKVIESMVRCKFSLDVTNREGLTPIEILLERSVTADFPLKFL